MAVTSFGDCVSGLERSQRLTSIAVSILLWIIFIAMSVASIGGILVFGLIGYLVELIMAEYQARMVRAVGARVTPEQFPEVYNAFEEVCNQFNVKEDIPIVIIEAASVNALAVRFARKKMIVLFSEMLKAVEDSPAQLKFFLAHELCHCVLDHGPRRFIEIYKPAKFKRGRELTCDNAGVAAAGALAESQAALAKLTVGRHLWQKLDPKSLATESREIMSGLVGYFVGQYLTHPACGDRLQNAEDFAQAQGIA